MSKPTEATPAKQWDGVLRREVEFECKAVDVDARSVEVIASTSALDAHGDVLDQDWDLKRYKKNPVVLWNHNQFGGYYGSGTNRPEDFLPIGRAENVKVEGGKLMATLVFASAEANPLAEKVFKLFSEKMLRAVSVGFRPGKVTKETKNGREIYRLSENELREISAVPIGSNPEAVAKSIAFEREQLARVAAKEAPHGAEIRTMMTEEETKAFEAAKVAQGVAEKSLVTEQARVKTLEGELAAEKTLSAKLEKELETERKSVEEAQASVTAAELDKRQGVKFAPAEREELEALVKDVGIKRVSSLLDKRADIALTDPVKVEGKTIPKDAGAPTPVADVNGGSADLVKTASERARA